MPRHPASAVLLALAVALFGRQAADAQTPTGSVSLFGDYFPNRRDATELRARLFVEEKVEPSPRLRLTISGFVEGLLSRRPAPGPTRGCSRSTMGSSGFRTPTSTILGSRVDVLVGYARIAWGKLDEIQPTDVINPLDVVALLLRGPQRSPPADAARAGARARCPRT